MKKKLSYFYIAAFLLCCLVPSAGLLLDRGEVSRENRKMAVLPRLWTEEGWNQAYLQELGDWFQDHFAFRNEMVTANSCVMAAAGVSAKESVIVGTDGWLYYADSMDDYQGRNQLSDRALFDIAHTLAMLKSYLDSQGVQLLFTVAPNKNSLYGEQMPYYLQHKVSDRKNLTEIRRVLEEEQVPYLDLYQLFYKMDDVLYHKRDSHWDNRGAAFAADAILEALQKEHIDYGAEEYEVRCDFEGDLDAMLFPAALTPEEEYYYISGPEFLYVEPVESNFDSHISTQSVADGSLVMYRDSFGNALLPFLAESFGSAYFSRGVPYDLSDLIVHGADTLVIERAERFLPEMAANPPMLQSPYASLDGTEQKMEREGFHNFSVETVSVYTKVSGTFGADMPEGKEQILARTESGAVYEAYPIHTEDDMEGFVLYLYGETEESCEESLELFLR